jgi:hypothetical protein
MLSPTSNRPSNGSRERGASASRGRPAIERMREEHKEPTYFEDYEYLTRLMVDMNRERGVPSPTQEQLRQTMEDEAVIGEETPALTE